MIDQMRKMASLSKEFEKHGFRDSAANAMNQAVSGVISEPEGASAAELALDIRRLTTTVRAQAQTIKDLQEALKRLAFELDDLKAFRKRLVQGEQQSQPEAHPRTGAYAPASDKKPSDKPIDRNGVAPSEIKIEDIFYFGKR